MYCICITIRELVALVEYRQIMLDVIDEVFELMQKVVIKLNYSDQGMIKIQKVDVSSSRYL